jgi:hypothetical protein
MSFLSRLFGGDGEDAGPLQNTPVQDWPIADGKSPQVSLEREVLESFSVRVPFGAPFDALRAFGRPDGYESRRESVATLTYHRWGLLLEIELGRFVQAAYLIGEQHRDESRPNLALAEPRGPDGRALTMRTTQDELLQRFGPPGNLQDLEYSVILYYNVGPLVSEFELREGGLIGWDVYLD